ncbi:hypothetical protein J6590_100125 [Homalodisca vitripennis]|nr:hypothetical protein J6590_100125 [Homalodisca vitripennis]
MATGILMNDIKLPVAGKTESHNSDTEMRKLFSYLKTFQEKEGLVVETTNVGVLHLQPTEDMELCAVDAGRFTGSGHAQRWVEGQVDASPISPSSHKNRSASRRRDVSR